jgi:hypothetical protein
MNWKKPTSRRGLSKRSVLLLLALVVLTFFWFMSDNKWSFSRFLNFSAPRCKNGKGTCFYVEGFQGCGFFRTAACLAQKLEEQHQGEVKVFVTMRSRESWPQALEERKKEIPGSEEHRTSPIVYEVREMVLSIYLNLSFCCRVVLQKMTRHQPASSLLGALQSFFKKLQEDLGQLTCQIVRTFDLRESKFCLGQY